MVSDTPTIQIEEYLVAAVLVAQGIPLTQAALGPRGRVLFQFPTGEVSHLIKAHERGELMVNSRAMTRALEAVKSAMFKARRGGGSF